MMALGYHILKVYNETQKVCKKHMGGYLGPSTWTDNIFKKILIVPLKATIIEKFPFTI
jgi:hypothetical protein